MPSHSESPAPGPALHDRQLSAASAARPHFVTKHSRTASHGKTLHKLGRTQSAANVSGHGHGHALETRNHHQHQRKKSGSTLQPSVTPVHTTHQSLESQVDTTTTTTAAVVATRQTSMKKNPSHVHLPKNKSHTQLRKNKSAGTLAALGRNTSHGALSKLGTAQHKLGAPPKQRKSRELDQRERNKAVFELEGNSDDEGAGDNGDAGEEAEWEDSTTLSPELTRNNTRTNTPQDAPSSPAQSRPPPTSAPTQRQSPPSQGVLPDNASSPPTPSLPRNDRSAPNLRNKTVADPALLYQYGRASRAPPAMTTTMAHASTGLPRNESTASLARLKDGVSERSSISDKEKQRSTAGAAQIARQSSTFDSTSSTSAGVSHFLPTSNPSEPSASPSSRLASRPPPNTSLAIPSAASNSGSASDSDSEASADEDTRSFLANYRPLVSQQQSPDAPRAMLNKTRVSGLASRTQQKLDLARRESMRGNPPISTHGSLLSLHSGRTNSRGRLRSTGSSTTAGMATAGGYSVLDAQRTYDTAIRQLMVVRRFRNPVLESLGRMYQTGTLATNLAAAAKSSSNLSSTALGRSSRPPSRRSQHQPTQSQSQAQTKPSAKRNTNSNLSSNFSTSPEKQKSTSTAKPPAQVQFYLSRPTSNDTISTAPAPATNTSISTPTGTSPESIRTTPSLNLQSEQTERKRRERAITISDEEALIRRLWGGISPTAQLHDASTDDDDDDEDDEDDEQEHERDRKRQVRVEVRAQARVPNLSTDPNSVKRGDFR